MDGVSHQFAIEVNGMLWRHPKSGNLLHFRTGAVEQKKYWGRGLSASKTILAECHYQLVWSVQENFWLNKPTHDTQWPETALNFSYSKLTVHWTNGENVQHRLQNSAGGPHFLEYLVNIGGLRPFFQREGEPSSHSPQSAITVFITWHITFKY